MGFFIGLAVGSFLGISLFMLVDCVGGIIDGKIDRIPDEPNS